MVWTSAHCVDTVRVPVIGWLDICQWVYLKNPVIGSSLLLYYTEDSWQVTFVAAVMIIRNIFSSMTAGDCNGSRTERLAKRLPGETASNQDQHVWGSPTHDGWTGASQTKSQRKGQPSF